MLVNIRVTIRYFTEILKIVYACNDIFTIDLTMTQVVLKFILKILNFQQNQHRDHWQNVYDVATFIISGHGQL